MNKATNNKEVPQKTSWELSIWMYQDDKNLFNKLLDTFKAKNKQYSNITFKLESFSDYEEYMMSLESAFLQGKAPDIFVLNNNEDSLLKDQIAWLDPSILSPQDFRKNFKTFFGEDLIETTTIQTPENEEEKMEFVIWIPLWYETLGIFYNRRFVDSEDVSSWASISSSIKKIREKWTNVIPLALGNGFSVPYASDILTQFFLLEDITSLEDAESSKKKQALATYLSYGDENGDNAYNAKFIEMLEKNETALDLFASEEIAIIIGYPRILSDLTKSGFKKRNFLFASPFPHYFETGGKSLVNYDYFVINKNTAYYDVASDLLVFMTSEEAEKTHLSSFPYYLPALTSLEADSFSEKVDSDYNITRGDFYDFAFIYSSFNKGIKSLYDTEVVQILDDSLNAQNNFDTFRNTLLCRYKKIVYLENLSSPCK